MAKPHEKPAIIRTLEEQAGKTFNQLNNIEAFQKEAEYLRCAYVLAPEQRVIALAINNTHSITIDFSLLVQLPHLTHLDLSDSGIKDLSLLKQLNALQSLNLTLCKGIQDLAPLQHLTALQSLNLTLCNSIQDLAPLQHLTTLQSLNLRVTGIQDLAPLQHLTALQSLDLQACRGIKDLAPLQHLTALQSLDLRYTGIQDASALRPLWQQGTRIDLSGNENLTTPPLEIIKQGSKAILAFLDALEAKNAPRPLNEVKVLLVGDGEAGKTSLSKQLRGEDFNPKESQTHGITIKEWGITCGTDAVTAHLWDFGGQEIMHATHQFFLSKRSLYLLVLDSRRDEKTEYWLKHIQTFGGGSPVLVVLNKIDENPGFEVNRKSLLAKYPNIAGFYRISCKKGDGLQDLAQAITACVDGMEICKHAFPATWWQVKEWINQHQAAYITLEEFYARCQEEGIDKPNSQKALLGFLGDLGLTFQYEHDLRTLVFDPEWLTQAVYRIINAEAVAYAQGVAQQEALGTILADHNQTGYAYGPEWHPYIMGLMVSFRLCYPLPDTTTHWLVPDLLPVETPDYTLQAADAVRFYYQYDFLPRSLFPRLLVQWHQQLDYHNGQRLQWRTGCVLRQAEAQAQLAVDYEARTVQLTIAAPTARARTGFLYGLYNALEGIHKSFSPQFQAKTKALVPVPGFSETAIPYKDLLAMEKLGQQEVLVPGHEKTVPVSLLLDGVAGENRAPGQGISTGDASAFIQGSGNTVNINQWPAHQPQLGVGHLAGSQDMPGAGLRPVPKLPGASDPAPITRNQVFISYAHEDDAIKKRVERKLKMLKNQNLVPGYWVDSHIKTGQAWHEEIMNGLAATRVAILLVSEAFLSSPFIMKEEWPYIKEHDLTVLPLLLDQDSVLGEDFSKIQFVNTLDMPFNSMDPAAQSATLTALAQRVREIFEGE